MGFSSTVCYRNEVGKILAKLRVDFGESQTRQAERLGYNASLLKYCHAYNLNRLFLPFRMRHMPFAVRTGAARIFLCRC